MLWSTNTPSQHQWKPEEGDEELRKHKPKPHLSKTMKKQQVKVSGAEARKRSGPTSENEKSAKYRICWRDVWSNTPGLTRTIPSESAACAENAWSLRRIISEIIKALTSVIPVGSPSCPAAASKSTQPSTRETNRTRAIFSKKSSVTSHSWTDTGGSTLQTDRTNATFAQNCSS